jgi:hypothetical protein
MVQQRDVKPNMEQNLPFGFLYASSFLSFPVTRLDNVIRFEDYDDDRRGESLLVSLGHRKLHDIAKKRVIVILIDSVVSSLHANMVNDLT